MILRYGQPQEAANDESPIPRTRNAIAMQKNEKTVDRGGTIEA